MLNHVLAVDFLQHYTYKAYDCQAGDITDLAWAPSGVPMGNFVSLSGKFSAHFLIKLAFFYYCVSSSVNEGVK